MQSHPAPFSESILDRLRELMQGERRARVLDPFGGTGRVLDALPPGTSATIIDIEPSFIEEGLLRYDDIHPGHLLAAGGIEFGDHLKVRHTGRVVADWRAADSRSVLRRQRKTYTHIITSPTYGNRFTDGFNPAPGRKCRSYAQSKGGPLNDGNTGAYRFDDPRYGSVNTEVMELAVSRLVDGGKVIVNVSDFYRTFRKGEVPTRIPVVRWWVDLLFSLGLSLVSAEPVATRRYKEGENRHRVEYETILVFEKGEHYVGPSTRAKSRG